MLNEALDGDLNSQDIITENLYLYYRQDNDNDAYINYLYFISNIAIGTCKECYWNDYSSCIVFLILFQHIFRRMN